ncbi:MAG TPA: hypothetical protein VIC85_02895 [Ktedonobacterales bacterium]
MLVLDKGVTMMRTSESIDTVDALRLRVEQLEAENAAMRPIVTRMAEARMCRDMVTMIESCPHCSLKRGGAYGYSGKHDETCVVAQARRLEPVAAAWR